MALGWVYGDYKRFDLMRTFFITRFPYYRELFWETYKAKNEYHMRRELVGRLHQSLYSMVGMCGYGADWVWQF